MATYKVEFSTHIGLTVTVKARDDEDASEQAWELAEEFLLTVVGDNRNVTAYATLDGIDADNVTAID
jgi:hypothetical protein